MLTCAHRRIVATTTDGLSQGVSLCVTKADFAAAEARVRPSALRELAVEVPRVAWADVGGLGDVKQRCVGLLLAAFVGSAFCSDVLRCRVWRGRMWAAWVM